MKRSVSVWEEENGRNDGNYTDCETEEENVENNPLLKCVPMSLPSARLSSHYWRLNFKKILATRVFSTGLLFHLLVESDKAAFESEPDTVRLVTLQTAGTVPRGLYYQIKTFISAFFVNEKGRHNCWPCPSLIVPLKTFVWAQSSHSSQ